MAMSSTLVAIVVILECRTSLSFEGRNFLITNISLRLELHCGILMIVGGGLLLTTCCDSDCNTCDKDRSHE